MHPLVFVNTGIDALMQNKCEARTREGRRCRNNAADSSGYCRVHHPDDSKRPSTGSSFEQHCLKVLRLLGYSVERNVTVSACQIDILAVYRTGIIPLRLMVECKDYASDRPVGIKEAKEFAGALNTARGNAVDKGLLITTHGFTREAREFAEAAGIQLARFSDLATQLVSFDDYIDRIIAEYTSLPVSRYYIALSASEEEDYDIEDDSSFRRPLETVVSHILFEEGHDRVALLGNFGTGKSTFCTKYAFDLATQHKRDPATRIPVLVRLSDYESKLDIQALITNTLQFRYGVRIDLTLCPELQRLGRFILLFDGFDEMATRVDPDVLRDNLRELQKVSRIPENKFILTCRTHFFRDRVEAEILTDFRLLYIPEWGDRELREYLQKRFGRQWQPQLDRIHGTHHLAELAQTPLFMDMIVETLPKLGDEVRKAALYTVYTDKWIRDQSRRRGARLSSEERGRFVRELSVKMYLEGKSSCHYSEFTSMIRKRFDTVDAAQIDYLQSDVRTCTFLTRDTEGQYRFRHNSFMEFFVAQNIAEGIASGSSELLAARVVPVEARGFLVDILRDDPPADALRRWLRETEHGPLRDNCLSLAAALRVDLSGTALRRHERVEHDEERMAEFMRGDTAAFTELYREFWGPLVSYVERMAGDRSVAEDVATDVLLRLWRYRDRIANITQIRPWLFTAARNSFIDHLRRSRRHISFSDVQPSILEELVEPGSVQPTEQIAIRDVMEKLPQREQQVVRGVIILGKTHAEVGKELGISARSVSATLRRAMRTLQKLLRAPQ